MGWLGLRYCVKREGGILFSYIKFVCSLLDLR